MDIYIDSQIVVQTAAQWAADATVYTEKRLLVTSDAYYVGTNQRKFKIPDGALAWSALDYMPLDRLEYSTYIDNASTPHLWKLQVDSTGAIYTTDLGVA